MATESAENFVIIWFDRHCQEQSERQRSEGFKLTSKFYTFNCPNACQSFVEEEDKKCSQLSIIIIIAGSLAEENLPKLQKYSSVISFVIFCYDKSLYEHLRYPKLRGVFDQRLDVIRHLERLVKKPDDILGFSIFQTRRSSYPFRNVEQQKLRLIWFRTFHKLLPNSSYDDEAKAKEELVNQLLLHSPKYESSILEFRDQSIEENAKNAVFWYTKNFNLYLCLNDACRSENLRRLYSFRYMIKLISKQLADEHVKYINEIQSKTNSNFILYRAELVDEDHLNLLKRNIESLISFNGFLSTSIKEDQVRMVWARFNVSHSNKVLYKIRVHPNLKFSAVFADISHLSDFRVEKEVLFSFGSIFKIDLVEFDELRSIHIVHLSLSEQNQFTLNGYIQETYDDNGDPRNQAILFGKLLFDLGESQFALEYFLQIHSRILNEKEEIQAIYFNNLGVCYAAIGDQQKAKENYEKSSNLYQNLHDERALSLTNYNIASILFDEKKFDEARILLIQVLNSGSLERLKHASALDLLSSIASVNQNEEEARGFLYQSLRIRQEVSEMRKVSHPDVAVSYERLGFSYLKSKQYDKAKSNYEIAARLYAEHYLENHPSRLRIDENLKKLNQIESKSS